MEVPLVIGVEAEVDTGGGAAVDFRFRELAVALAAGGGGGGGAGAGADTGWEWFAMVEERREELLAADDPPLRVLTPIAVMVAFGGARSGAFGADALEARVLEVIGEFVYSKSMSLSLSSA